MISFCFNCEVILQIIYYAHICDSASHIYKDLGIIIQDMTSLLYRLTIRSIIWETFNVPAHIHLLV
jgi:hypothetical protein